MNARFLSSLCRRGRRRYEWGIQAGYASVELALSLPVLVLLCWAGIGAISVVSMQGQAQDAAREAARLSARGDDPSALLVAHRIAVGSAVSIDHAPVSVTVTVSRTTRPFGPLLPAMTVQGRSVAVSESPTETLVARSPAS